MRLTFVSPSTARPVGGVAVLFEFASAMTDRGHEVHVVHADMFRTPIRSLADVSWFDFDPRVVHHFAGPWPVPGEAFPPAEVTFCYMADEEFPQHGGLPAVVIQGHKMLPPQVEQFNNHAPCPKICVAKWLTEVAIREGVPPEQLVHVPLGLHHERFRLTVPIVDRPLRLSYCYNSHPQKAPELSLEVIRTLLAQIPDLEVVVFSATEPRHDIPDACTLYVRPSERQLVDDIYNRSRVFLCASEVEGFGLPSVEAMACGAALVTTANGGHLDYAIPDETALVAPPGDTGAIVGHVRELLLDDDRRIALAGAGQEYARRFDWTHSARRLEAFLESYLADPVAYGRPG